MANMIDWSEELSVGVAEIDNQHKVLVGLLNEFNEALQQKKGSEVSLDILRRLNDYTKIHFAVEESMMRLLDYPDYDDHKAEHDHLINELHQLEEKLASGKHSVNFELLHFLKLWLTKHILESDKQYTPHFLSFGINPDAGETHHESWVGKVFGKFLHK